MTLQTSGPISMNDILNEFGASKPLSMSQLYRGGQYVSSSTGAIPASGAISLGNFYGVSKAFTFNAPISANLSNYNLATILTANGWDGNTMVDVTITVNSGVVVYSDNVSIPAINIGTFPAGSSIRLINRGHIVGMGGAGGIKEGQNGQDGGTALLIRHLTSIENYGVIAGGGGGGAGAAIKNYIVTGVSGGGGQSGLVNSTTPPGIYKGEEGTFDKPGVGGLSYALFDPNWIGGKGGAWGFPGHEFVNYGNEYEKFSLPGAGGKSIDGYSYSNIILQGAIIGKWEN